MNEKKLTKSAVVILLYIAAGLMLAYTLYQAYSSVMYVFSYYGAYGLSPQFSEVAGYILQSAYQPLVLTILLAAAARILHEVRALNPSYYINRTMMAPQNVTNSEVKLQGSIEAVDSTPEEEALKEAEENL